jgi:hypothetical protein
MLVMQTRKLAPAILLLLAGPTLGCVNNADVALAEFDTMEVQLGLTQSGALEVSLVRSPNNQYCPTLKVEDVEATVSDLSFVATHDGSPAPSRDGSVICASARFELAAEEFAALDEPNLTVQIADASHEITVKTVNTLAPRVLMPRSTETQSGGELIFDYSPASDLLMATDAPASLLSEDMNISRGIPATTIQEQSIIVPLPDDLPDGLYDLHLVQHGEAKIAECSGAPNCKQSFFPSLDLQIRVD